MNIFEIFQEQAARTPDKPAIIETLKGRSRSISFMELDQMSAQAASFLLQQGLQTGDVVLVFLPMSTDLYIIFLALFRLGLVAMILDPSAGPQHISQCCQQITPRAFLAISRAHLMRLMIPAVRKIPIKISVGLPLPGTPFWKLDAHISPPDDVSALHPDRPALITFTSGSTGEPKATVRAHQFLLDQHNAIEENFNLSRDDIVFSTFPMFVLSHLGTGISTVMPDADLRFPGAIRPAPVLQQLESHKISIIEAPPAFLECLIEFCEAQQKICPGIKKVFTGGAPVFPHLLKRLHSIFPKAEIHSVYGSTEAEPIAHIEQTVTEDPDRQSMMDGRGLLGGYPVAGVQVKILRDRWGEPLGILSAPEFSEMTLPPEKIGEIVVAGRHVLKGYLHGKGDQETKFYVKGQVWHRTGDAGYFDSRGRLWLMGRCSAKIMDQFGTIYPFSVECATYQNPSVRRAAFLSHQGQRILLIEPYKNSAPLSRDTLKRSINWAHIQAIVFVKQIPMDKRHNSKIDYPALKRILKRI